MYSEALSKRPKVVESGSKENMSSSDKKFVNETSYVVQLFHALGYDDISQVVIDIICDLIKEWMSVITTPVNIKGKSCLPYNVYNCIVTLQVVFASAVSGLLGCILPLLQ